MTSRESIEDIYKRMKEQRTTIRSIVLIFLGAGINFTFGYAVMLSSLNAMIQSPLQTIASNIPQTTVLLAIVYFLVGIIYSTCTSLAFQPKRIISPIYNQIITASFVPVLVIYILATVPRNPPMDLVTGSGTTLGLFILSLVIFLLAGIGQTFVVKSLVGLNGTKEDVNSFGLIINGKFSDVLKALKKPDVREVLRIPKEEDSKRGERSYVFRTPDGSNEQLFIAVIEDSQDNTKTQLATVSYRQTYYGIGKTGSLMEKVRKETIERALKDAALTFKDDNSDSLARLLAYTHGLAITESKLLGLKSMPPHSKAILIGLILMIAIVTGVWKVGYITLETYETFLIFAGFSALFDLLPLLKSKRRKLDLD